MKIPQTQEKFDVQKFSVIVALHLLCLPAMTSFSPLNFSLFALTHMFFGVFGISLGYHKFLSHRSFVPKPAFAKFLATVATFCFQGGPLFWASGHRWHHRLTDQKGDPHSAARGFWWAHLTWLFYKNPNGYSYRSALLDVPDLKKDAYFCFLEKYSTLLNLITLASAAALLAYFNKLDLWFWIFPMRIVAVWHTTWMINSLAHGLSPFRKNPSKAVNRLSLTFLLYGEGLHGNHHEHPSRPSNSQSKWQWDVSYYVLKAFKKIGWVQLIRPESIEEEPSTREEIKKAA